MKPRRIRADDLRGLPGLTRDAVATLILRQPKTVREAISIKRVGRRLARHLLERGLITDPDNTMSGRRAAKPEATGSEPARFVDQRVEVRTLLDNARAKLPALEELLDLCSGTWGYEDNFYRFYHHSFKVYGAQWQTLQIVEALQSLVPNRPLNEAFMTIVRAGTGLEFEPEHNQRWIEVTAPMVEAFLHARFFLEMAVLYSQTLKDPPTLLPSGWAALLYLYNLR